MENEYDVYYHKYASAMSDELLGEDVVESDNNTNSEVAKEEVPSSIQLDGYTTEFDTRIALTPVELVPIGTHTV
jgi:hypothetical protein